MVKDMKIEKINIKDIIPYNNNAKEHPQKQIEQIKKSIQKFGFNDPIAIDEKNVIIEGHGRLYALQQLGYKEIDCIRIKGLTDEQKRAYILVHNKLTMNTGFDLNILDEELSSIINIDMSDFDFEDINIDILNNDKNKETLFDKFIIPPFSILDTRRDYWQKRKKEWYDLGIVSQKGRDDCLINKTLLPSYADNDGLKGFAPMTSIFDPVLCEICYKWFCTNNGIIYDCFAGGSVRGIVAEKLGYKYFGIDLRQEQINANNSNAKQIGIFPTWYCDDSLNVDNYLENESVDMIFSCPPYFDLEVYSDDKRDISNMDYDEFINTYNQIIKKACNKLKPNRFAIFVVGDVRDGQGFYRDFITETKTAFKNQGLKLYNELILLEPVGTGAMRANKTFGSLRKVIKVHQNVLVFYKGDPKEIKKNYDKIEVENLNEDE